MSEEYATTRSGLFRRVLSRLLRDEEAIDASELREEARESGHQAVEECRDRQQVTLSGTLRAVTLRPRAGTPVLEAELYDGSGTVTLVWIGRRRIAGIDAGRRVVVSGRVAVQPDRRVMYNPRYELRPDDE